MTRSESIVTREFKLSLACDSEHADHVRVRVLESYVGEQAEEETQTVLLPSELVQACDDLKLLSDPPSLGFQIGAELGRLLFPPAVLDLLQRAWQHLGPYEALRIRLGFAISADGLQRIPWELAAVALMRGGPIEHLGDQSNVTLVRFRLSKHVASASQLSDDRPATRILSLLSNPDPNNLGPVDFVAERVSLERASKAATHLSLQFIENPKRTDFVLDWLKPIEVLHFAGHGAIHDPGDGTGLSAGLYFAAPTSGSQWVKAEVIAIEARRRRACLAILNACNSAKQIKGVASDLPAAFARAGVPIVIGYSEPVDDRTAAVCLDEIAECLVTQDQFEPAIAKARIQLKAMYPSTCRWATLVLYARPEGAASLYPSLDDPDGRVLTEAARQDAAFLAFFQFFVLPIVFGISMLALLRIQWVFNDSRATSLVITLTMLALTLFGLASWYNAREFFGSRAYLLHAIGSAIRQLRASLSSGRVLAQTIRRDCAHALRVAQQMARITHFSGLTELGLAAELRSTLQPVLERLRALLGRLRQSSAERWKK